MAEAFLTRTVRCAVNPAPASWPVQRVIEDATRESSEGRNGFAARPGPRGLARYYEFDARCVGQPDARTGYLLNIKDIDEAFRGTAFLKLVEACHVDPLQDASTLLVTMARALGQRLDDRHGVRLDGLCWRLTPVTTLEARMSGSGTQDAVPRVVWRQRFDFAAAHRLHCGDLSDEENRRVFGRCNNPAGHGHNYRVEPAVSAEPGAVRLADIERVVDETIIDPFDHTHLNLDTAEFGDAGVNPSVENIARVFFDRLRPRVAEAFAGRAELTAVTVWETDRTSCTYPAGA
mgnify:CR=1 FL=1